MTVPVTMSGCWYSSPSFFQYSASLKMAACASRAFSSWNRGSSVSWAGVVRPSRRSISSTSGITSASMTRISWRLRNWLRSRRAVSVFASMLWLPPLRNPATRMRWNAPTSIFA